MKQKSESRGIILGQHGYVILFDIPIDELREYDLDGKEGGCRNRKKKSSICSKRAIQAFSSGLH